MMGRIGSLMLGIACLVGAGVAVYYAAAASPPIAPGVYADAPVIDMGELAQGDTRSARFELTNHHPESITCCGFCHRPT